MGYTPKAVSTICYSEKVCTRTVSSTWRQTLWHGREMEGPGSILLRRSHCPPCLPDPDLLPRLREAHLRPKWRAAWAWTFSSCGWWVSGRARLVDNLRVSEAWIWATEGGMGSVP